MDDPAHHLEGLTSRQRQGLQSLLNDLRSSLTWSWQLPVLIRQRCWLRLETIQLSELHRWLPPDGCEDAPELARYRELVALGWSPLQAQEQCWQEFGDDDCRIALQRFWASQHDRKHDWTLQRYLAMVSRYRQSIEAGVTTIPMLVLPRSGAATDHQLHWVSDSTPPMRHTCA